MNASNIKFQEQVNLDNHYYIKFREQDNFNDHLQHNKAFN